MSTRRAPALRLLAEIGTASLGRGDLLQVGIGEKFGPEYLLLFTKADSGRKSPQRDRSRSLLSDLRGILPSREH